MVHLIMKFIMILIFTVIMGLFSLNGQSLTLQNLIDLSGSAEETALKENLKSKGFYFSGTNQNAQANLYVEEQPTLSCCQEEVQELNRFVYLNVEDYQEMKFMTSDEKIYRALLEELRSETMQFYSFEKQKNAFREGDEIIFTSALFPDLFIKLTDVKVFENNSESNPISVSRYEFKVVRS